MQGKLCIHCTLAPTPSTHVFLKINSFVNFFFNDKMFTGLYILNCFKDFKLFYICITSKSLKNSNCRQLALQINFNYYNLKCLQLYTSLANSFINTRSQKMSLSYLYNQIKFLVKVSVYWLQKTEFCGPRMHMEESWVILGSSWKALKF